MDAVLNIGSFSLLGDGGNFAYNMTDDRCNQL